jgi:hypothetical protein
MSFGSFNPNWGSYSDYTKSSYDGYASDHSEKSSKSDADDKNYSDRFKNVPNWMRDKQEKVKNRFNEKVKKKASESWEYTNDKVKEGARFYFSKIDQDQDYYAEPEKKNVKMIENEVNEDNFSVSLISGGSDWYGHASILIHMKDPKGYQTLRAHISKGNANEAEVKIENRNGIGWECESSHRWIVPAWKVWKMLKKMQREGIVLDKDGKFISGPKEKVYFDLIAYTKDSSPIQIGEFNELWDHEYLRPGFDKDLIPHQWMFTGHSGNYKEFMVPDNCLSWAARKLQMLDIECPIKVNGYVPSFPKYSVGNYGQESLKTGEKFYERPFTKCTEASSPEEKEKCMKGEYFDATPVTKLSDEERRKIFLSSETITFSTNLDKVRQDVGYYHSDDLEDKRSCTEKCVERTLKICAIQ